MSVIAAIHVAKRQLGLDDETYRDLIERETGKRSAGELTSSERRRLLQVFEGMGFKRRGKKPGLDGRFAGKLQALWIAGWNLGLVRDRRDTALTAFVKRQTGLDAVRFCHDPEDAKKAIEALKSWLARDGGVSWAIHQHQTLVQQTNGYRIARAQWVKLGRHPRDMQAGVMEILGRNIVGSEPPNHAEWIDVMNALGREIRGETS